MPQQTYKTRGIHKLPEHMRDGVENYIEHGTKPGDFLLAIFSNRFVSALKRADDINTKALDRWATFLYNDAPGDCWGSTAKVKAWIKRGGRLGI